MTDDLFAKAAGSIVEQDREGAIEIAKEALAAGIAPTEIMQSGFVRGIAEVGELFEAGELPSRVDDGCPGHGGRHDHYQRGPW